MTCCRHVKRHRRATQMNARTASSECGWRHCDWSYTHTHPRGCQGGCLTARRLQIRLQRVPTALQAQSKATLGLECSGGCPTTTEMHDALVAQLTSLSVGVFRFISEFWIPVSNERADLVVANGSLTAYEIKGPSDRLHRFPRQVLAYGRIFDRCTALLAERHLRAARLLLPGWWGISVVSEPSWKIEAVRLPEPNPSIDVEAQSHLLWRGEVEAALRQLHFAPNPDASRGELRSALTGLVPLDTVREIVRTTLIRRADGAARIPTRRYAAARSNALS